ncbi:MAG: FAD:protein FMN transferase [Prevotellaceae bacterium]|nr:FAD:protein FMN transferase [Prevotellaceae bacterium]MDO4931072.1 FAD:protein FMN transferase [Prevotellaceae bacterium]
MKKKNICRLLILPLAILSIVAVAVFGERRNNTAYQRDSGFIFGTSYNIIYQSDNSLKKGIEQTLAEVDNSLSPFNKESVITAVNENRDMKVDKMFADVYGLARQVYVDTDGAFDITVGPLVNAWGFGFKSGTMPTDKEVDRIRGYVGMEKISLNGRTIEKQDPRTLLDCSAIAKGYGVDMVADYLKSQGIKNYMVEIGGEIAAKGHNANGNAWKIGVTKPTDDTLAVKQDIQAVLTMTDIAMATSGNYRNYYYKNGKKYAHTIDPKTGYPVQHSILSTTVIADNCAKADAYATAFMVLGLNKAQKVLSRHNDIKAYIIYSDDKGKTAVWCSPELKDNITE